jgi:predicted PurR-regulated permease PerM
LTPAANTAPTRKVAVGPILTAIVFTVLLLWLIGRAVDVLILVFIAVLLSLYLGAVSDGFERRLRIRRGMAFTLAVLVSLGGLVGLFYLLVPPVISQTQQLIKVLPNYITGWENDIARLVARMPALQEFYRPEDHQLLHAAYDRVSGQFGDLVPKLFGLVETAVSVFSVIVMSLYLGLNPGVYRETMIEFCPPVHRDLVRDVLGSLANQLRRYIVGQLTTMAILGGLTAIGLKILGVPYWLTFGVFTGLVAVVPFFGSLLSTLLPALFVLSEPNGGNKALLVIGLGVFIHLLEGNLISPRIMSSALELPPVLTIVAVLIVGKLLGPMGLLVAMPLLAAVMVVARRILINRIYEGHGFRKTTRDRTLVLRVPASDGGVSLPATPIDIIAFLERDAVHASA